MCVDDTEKSIKQRRPTGVKRVFLQAIFTLG